MHMYIYLFMYKSSAWYPIIVSVMFLEKQNFEKIENCVLILK